MGCWLHIVSIATSRVCIVFHWLVASRTSVNVKQELELVLWRISIASRLGYCVL
jgi:hypothetical protein